MAAPVCTQFEVADVSHCEGSYLLGSCKPSRRECSCHFTSLSPFVFPRCSMTSQTLIYQFAIASKNPISKQMKKQLECELKVEK